VFSISADHVDMVEGSPAPQGGFLLSDTDDDKFSYVSLDGRLVLFRRTSNFEMKMTDLGGRTTPMTETVTSGKCVPVTEARPFG
jgi:hypothetical protein